MTRPVLLVLVTAAWSLPARPATTALRELAPRWGGDIHPLVADARPDVLDLLHVESVPTWIFLRPAPEGEPAATPEQGHVRRSIPSGICVHTADGQETTLDPGDWEELDRFVGALPKVEIDRRFGHRG
jgi:hypothetical protein